MPPSLWFFANWIWVATIIATVGLVVYLMMYRRQKQK
ncbi:hypothetical protein C7459_10315 [Tumebacillus permanentifrigoris]|uniref:Uncharacterized protein n=1 Tax=Tumebacillus permanentifrigoris TaxID=378543 RepID=A0A316DE68_9BACL|nr:hypothetical protein C7459_10315 [Tumebacillus permanentifrigoris]